MEAVEEAVYKDFEKWKKEEGNSQKKVDDFMEEMYAMKVEKGNIFDKIKAMSLPPISQDDAGTSALLEKLEACREQANKMSNRKKRSAAHRAQGENHSCEYFISNCCCFRMSTKSKCKDPLEYGHLTYLPWVSWLSICNWLGSLCEQMLLLGRSQRRNLRILGILCLGLSFSSV